MFRTVPLSVIRSFSLYTQQWYVYMSANLYDIYHLCGQWRTPDDVQRNCPKHVEFNSKNKFEKLVHLLGFIIRFYYTGLLTACEQAVSKPIWHISLLYVQWKIPDDGQRNCPKHVEFYSKNKSEKLVHLVGFIIRINHDARSPERQINNTLHANI